MKYMKWLNTGRGGGGGEGGGVDREFDKTVRIMHMNSHLSVHKSKQEVFANDVVLLF